MAGCSTGEEAYSFAMLFREHITAAKRDVQLQVFASDVDPDAVAAAREGRYGGSIVADVSPDRLARFFSKGDHGYKVSAELRATVIFTIHDVIADPPFSRLDLVSCRNLLIYLGPEAQAKVIARFHFALREDGFLMLGSAETAGHIDGRFEMVSKPVRIYRNIGRGRAGDISIAAGDGVRPPTRASQGVSPPRPAALAELCRRLVLDGYAPAAVLINRKSQCIYSMGPTDRYLRMAAGHPTHAIVQRLGKLLGHQVSVRSKPGKGSVFAIEVALPPVKPARQPERRPNGKDIDAVEPAHRTGTVLVVEDDPEVRSLLELLLQDEGHHVAIAPDGPAALALADAGAFTPDILLTDFNLPAALNGLQLAARLREAFHTALPVIILTGDITTGTLGDIASQNCVRLTKPVKATELAQAVQRLLPAVPAKSPAFVAVPKTLEKSLIIIVDDDGNLRDAMRAVLEAEGWRVKSFATCEAFLGAYRPGDDACLLVDAYLPGMSGLELLKALRSAGHRLPAIMITGNSDAAIAVAAMKAGASDFIEKPVSGTELVENIGRVLEQARDTNKLDGWRGLAAKNIAGLTARERQILARAGAAGAGGLQCCGWIVPPLRPWVVSESIGAARIKARYFDTQHGSENEQHVDALALAANSPPRPAVNSLEQA